MLFDAPQVKYATREAWLKALAERFEGMFFDGAIAPPLPSRRVSCGWPKGRGKDAGQCFNASSSADHTYEIFVSPELADPLAVAATLLHQCIHAACGLECGHRGPFKAAAKLCGLVGPMKATEAGKQLEEALQPVLEALGPYPHARLAHESSHKAQECRMVKLKCGTCGMVIRTARQWIENPGPPVCACGGAFQLEGALAWRVNA